MFRFERIHVTILENARSSKYEKYHESLGGCKHTFPSVHVVGPVGAQTFRLLKYKKEKKNDLNQEYMSHRMGKPTICIGENKGADQLRSNCEADQRLCFFAIRIVQFLYFLNPKSLASNYLL